jgi:hypothetical protein
VADDLEPSGAPCHDCGAVGVRLYRAFGHYLCHECRQRRLGFDQLELVERDP